MYRQDIELHMSYLPIWNKIHLYKMNIMLGKIYKLNSSIDSYHMSYLQSSYMYLQDIQIGIYFNTVIHFDTKDRLCYWYT